MRRRPVVLGGLVAAALFMGFWELGEVYATAPAVLAFDAAVAGAIHSLRAAALTPVMRVVTATGGTGFSVAVAVGCLALLVRRGSVRGAGLLAAVVATSAISTALLKVTIERPRPSAANALLALPQSFSFPSGHTTASLALGGVLAYLAARSSMSVAGRVLGVALAVAYPVLVGTSRVYLGVHWPSDVLASWMLAGGILALGVALREAIR